MSKFNLFFFTNINAFEIYKYDDRSQRVDCTTQFIDLNTKWWVFRGGDELFIHWSNDCPDNKYLRFKKHPDSGRDFPFDGENEGKKESAFSFYHLKKNGDPIKIVWNKNNSDDYSDWPFDFCWGESAVKENDLKRIDPRAKIKPPM